MGSDPNTTVTLPAITHLRTGTEKSRPRDSLSPPSPSLKTSAACRLNSRRRGTGTSSTSRGICCSRWSGRSGSWRRSSSGAGRWRRVYRTGPSRSGSTWPRSSATCWSIWLNWQKNATSICLKLSSAKWPSTDSSTRPAKFMGLPRNTPSTRTDVGDFVP